MPAFKDLSAVDKSARLELARKKLGPGVSRDEWADICKGLGLKKVVGSTGIYGGTCLFCLSPKNFYFWLDGISGIRCRCFNCNFEGHVRTSMTPHRKPNRGDEF